MILTPIRGRVENFDLNVTENEVVFDVGPYTSYSIQVIPNSAWSSAVLTVSRSNDGKTPVTPEEGVTTITPTYPMTPAMSCAGFDKLMIRLTTNEGATASCDIFVSGKP